MKKTFIYRNLKFVLIWMLIIGLPIIWFAPNLLDGIEGALYYAVNVAITIALVFIIWRLVDILPWIKRKGYYWKENGITVIEYGNKREVLDSVTELMLTDKHASSRAINLLIRNNERKIEFLSEALDKDAEINDTVFYNMYSQILAENPHLKQEKDIWGEDIDYWYKAR